MSKPKNLTLGDKKSNYQGDSISTAVRRGLGIGGAAILLSVPHIALSQAGLGPVIEVSQLDGNNGFTVIGNNFSDSFGQTVSGAGDVNGDGVDDLIVGAHGGDPSSGVTAGESFVLFGGSGVGAGGFIAVSDLDGSDGFVINGVDRLDNSGISVSEAGDINGDGIDDVIIGAYFADPNGVNSAGESYVVFGAGNIGNSGALELSNLDGNDGFVLNGVGLGDRAGVSVSGTDDINGDGVDDLIIGANAADANGNSNAGRSYVVFGGGSVGSSGVIELANLDGSDGFAINGIDSNDESGISVSGAGDVNGDGIKDLLIGAGAADPNGNSLAGESYVVFGDESVGSSGTVQLSFLDGNDGFVLNGINANDYSARSVSAAGDVNGDGLDDLIIGASQADPVGGPFNTKLSAGESYVVFGRSNIGNSGTLELSALNGNNGYVINGAEQADRSGFSVSGAGDVNGDGVDDVIVGARGTTETYVIFGGSEVGSAGAIELEALGTSDGFIINGGSGASGFSVDAVGDFNGDGIDDVVVGDPSVEINKGEAYVVFGQAVSNSFCNGLAVTVDLNLGQTPGPEDDVVMGTPGADDIRGRAGNDTICGMGGADFIHGNSGDDWIDGGNGVDNIRGGQGSDILFSGAGATVGTSSRIFGGTGDDTIFGGPDADDLRGGRGDDLIYGEQGADELTGNDDDDTLYGGNGADTLKGGNGRSDELFGESGADSLNGGSGVNDLCDGGGQAGDIDTNCERF